MAGCICKKGNPRGLDAMGPSGLYYFKIDIEAA